MELSESCTIEIEQKAESAPLASLDALFQEAGCSPAQQVSICDVSHRIDEVLGAAHKTIVQLFQPDVVRLIVSGELAIDIDGAGLVTVVFGPTKAKRYVPLLQLCLQDLKT